MMQRLLPFGSVAQQAVPLHFCAPLQQS
jgi:hypothetical protein